MAHKQMYIIHEAGPGDFKSWDRFVDQAAGGGLFFTTEWADILAKATGRSFKLFFCLDKQEQIAGGILCWPVTRGHLHVLSQAPVTPYQSLLLRSDIHANAEKTRELTTELLEYLKKKFDFIDLMLPPEYTDVRAWLWQGFHSQMRYTYRFPIEPPEQMLPRFNTNLRRKIKVFDKADLQIELSEDPKPLLDMVESSYAAHGLKPTLQRTALNNLFAALLKTEKATLLYTRDKEGILAGFLAAHDRLNVYYFFSGINPRFRTAYNSDFLFHSLQAVPRWQGRQFDFMGANTPALEPFKRSFGGELTPFYRQTWYRNRWVRLLFTLRSWQQKKRRSLEKQA